MSRDISDVVLEGDAYEEATVLTRRVFPISITGKVRVCVVSLASTVFLLPAVAVRGDLIRQLEPTADGAPPAFVSVVGLGTVLTFLFGLAFLRQRHVVETRTLDFESAALLVRIEDLLMTFTVSTGLLFVFVPLVLAVVGAFSPETVLYLYQQDVRLYRPSGGSFLSTALVSATGVVLSVVLFVLEVATR